MAERVSAEVLSEHELVVSGAPVERVGELAFEAGVPLHELSLREASLEQAYMELTSGSVEFAAPAAAGSGEGS